MKEDKLCRCSEGEKTLGFLKWHICFEVDEVPVTA